ncbi:type VI secretion system Vgr family protein [Poseidonocella sp. HB161398]|uniref:type VI secretion system Vgr family protein n=1 Tax=Poseidonocella sp. HB161398 TaxID=2320855 RepID=UPI001109610C|nr:type VI secretion system tip protein TssI/VgrG [Poseidonocella sp. HB161398]
MSPLDPPPVAQGALPGNRHAAITAAPFPLEGVALRQVAGREALGEPFSYRVKFVSKDPLRGFGRLPGERMTVGLALAGRGLRHFNGLIARAEFLGIEDTRRLNYEVELVPWLALLGLRRTCRLFHGQTSLEIVRTILAEHGGSFDIRLRTRLPQRPTTVQYNETDLDFVSRLLEEDGISYYFEHSATGHRMILADGPSGHDPCSPEAVPTHLNLGPFRYAADLIWRWSERTALTPGRVALADYDHEKPRAALSALEPVPAAAMGDIRGSAARIQPGGASSGAAPASAAETEPGTAALRESFDFPGCFLSREDGAFRARRRAEAIACEAYRAGIEGSMRQISAGCVFRAENPYDAPAMAERTEPVQRWLAVASEFEITGEAGESGAEAPRYLYRARVEALPAETPYRPPLRTPRPRIAGPQTAVVIGAGGAAPRTDRLGRIRLRFHWDREGGTPASGWVRVAQPWAGKGFGGLVLPRAGQEVVVQFHDGNPDWPLVTGALYNADHLPPETLPAGVARSTFRSQSLPGGAGRYSEFRFDDSAGSEEVFLRAQRDYNLKVGETHRLSVGARYLLSAAAGTGPSRSFVEVAPDGIRLVLQGPAGPQGIEIRPEGVSIIGTTVGLMSRQGPVCTLPVMAPQPSPALTRALASVAIPPADGRIAD